MNAALTKMNYLIITLVISFFFSIRKAIIVICKENEREFRTIFTFELRFSKI